MKIDTVQAVVAKLLRKQEELTCAAPSRPREERLFCALSLDLLTEPHNEYSIGVTCDNAPMAQEAEAILRRSAMHVTVQSPVSALHRRRWYLTAL